MLVRITYVMLYGTNILNLSYLSSNGVWQLMFTLKLLDFLPKSYIDIMIGIICTVMCFCSCWNVLRRRIIFLLLFYQVLQMCADILYISEPLLFILFTYFISLYCLKYFPVARCACCLYACGVLIFFFFFFSLGSEEIWI